jgi:uncharacterized phage-like protein YoqJ
MIKKTEELRIALKRTIVSLINKGATTFLFGSMSAFDNLTWEIVTQLKKAYPDIKRVYVRSDYQYIDKSYEEYLLTLYEETYYPSKMQKTGKYVYVERNYEMIDSATYCVFYYSENHASHLQRKSGTKIAYEYAVKKKKEIINLYLPHSNLYGA